MKRKITVEKDAVNSSFLERRSFLQASSAALVVLSTASLRAATPPIGFVIMAAGTSFIVREGSDLAALRGERLLLEDVARTQEESRLDLQLGRGTRIRLGSKATLKIDRFVAGIDAAVTLTDGPTFVARDRAAEPTFKIKTPYALLAARGTMFFAGPSAGAFGVFVQEGVVEVRTRKGSVRLRGGEGTDIKTPGDPLSPVKRWGAQRIQAALASVE